MKPFTKRLSGFICLGGKSIASALLIFSTLLFFQTAYSQTSKGELEKQREEIKAINENLESMIVEHTNGIEVKNKELSEYAYIIPNWRYLSIELSTGADKLWTTP